MLFCKPPLVEMPSYHMFNSSHFPLSHKGKCTEINSGYWGLLGHRSQATALPGRSTVCPWVATLGGLRHQEAGLGTTWALTTRDFAVTFICDRPGRSQRCPGTAHARNSRVDLTFTCCPLSASPSSLLTKPAHFCCNVPTTDQSFSEFGRWVGMTTPRVLLSLEEVWDGNSAEELEENGTEVMWYVSLYQPIGWSAP